VAKPLPRSQVDGHAKGNKNTPYLQKLSNKRAIAVKTELTRQGVQADHIKYKGSGAVGRGMHVFITVDHIGARGHAPSISWRVFTATEKSKHVVIPLHCLAI
jgi:hypothetical protein